MIDLLRLRFGRVKDYQVICNIKSSYSVKNSLCQSGDDLERDVVLSTRNRLLIVAT